ncbi:hypothetical protein Tco_1041216 [Tanacetum coccineum]|uniref:Uncharacterized protein n=1 Tax=Tanacetum coccineum TaxID=301880 RepID=A0ABQ5GFJ4_9ASTR
MMVGCTQDILRQRDFLDRFIEVSWIIPTLVVIESKILYEFPRFLSAFVTKLTTGRIIDGVPCGKIDMVIKDLELEPKFGSSSQWEKLSNETGSEILPGGQGSCGEYSYGKKPMPNNGRVIGCLMYAMTYTRPDIIFAVGKSSSYTSNPSTHHWQAIQKVLKYLKKTIYYSLTYIDYPSVLEGYTGASWISNTKDNSSTSGWVFLLGGSAISWASKKKTCITSSIMEYEFVALASNGKEAEWSMNKEEPPIGMLRFFHFKELWTFGSYNIYELDMDTWLV